MILSMVLVNRCILSQFLHIEFKSELTFGGYWRAGISIFPRLLKSRSPNISKTLQPKSSAKTREPIVHVKSKKKAKYISKALEDAMKRDSSSEVKRDYTWESSSEVDI